MNKDIVPIIKIKRWLVFFCFKSPFYKLIFCFLVINVNHYFIGKVTVNKRSIYYEA